MSQVRLKEAYFGGLMEKQRGDPSHQEEEEDSEEPLASRRRRRRFRRLRQSCGWDLALQRRICCPKIVNVGRNPLHTEQVLQLTRKVSQKKTEATWDHYLHGSSLLHGEENLFQTTRWSYGRWECEFGSLVNVHEYHSSSSSSSWRRLWNEFALREAWYLGLSATTSGGAKRTGLWTEIDFDETFLEIDESIVRKSLSGHYCESLCLLRLSTLHRRDERWPKRSLDEYNKWYLQKNNLQELDRIDDIQTEFEW